MFLCKSHSGTLPDAVVLKLLGHVKVLHTQLPEGFRTPKLHLMLHLVLRSRWCGNPVLTHTFRDEGLNTKLKRACRHCHSAKFDGAAFCTMRRVLDLEENARANTKKLMGLGTCGISHRWSTLKPRADSLLEEMRNQYGASLTVVGEEDRWTYHASDATLPDTGTIKTKYAECMPATQITPQLKLSS